MNWIKEHTFVFGLSASTLVGAIVLWLFGSGAANRYEAAKEDYESALAEAQGFEKLKLYPTAQNLESKKRALEEYSRQTDELQKAFDAYRPGQLENISVQAFSDAIKRANKETREAFAAAEVAEDYFCGFEGYKTSLPPGNATGILNYELQAIEGMMRQLADAGITKLVNVHRPRLAEEDGKKYEPTPTQVARELPVEIVFQGTEASVRKFLSALVNNQQHYLVVRSLRIANEKLLPPRTTDARFERVAARRTAPTGDATSFDAIFGDVATPEGTEAPQPAAPAAPPTEVDTSRILHQVLGQEELQVFVRIDILLFLDPKELP